MDSRNILLFGFTAVVIFSIGLLLIPSLYSDFLWFTSIGLSNVFFTIINAKLMLGILSAILFFAMLYLNWWIIKKVLIYEGIEVKKTVKKIIPLVFGFSALLAGLVYSTQWSVLLKFMNATNFGIADSVFGNDISFYVFSLPWYTSILGFLLAITIISLFVSALIYLIFGKPFRIRSFQDISDEFFTRGKKGFESKMTLHLFILTGIFFIIIAIQVWLSRYDILFSEAGAVFGAAYSDIHVTLPMRSIISIVLGIVGLLFFAEWKLKNLRIPVIGIGIIILVLLIGGIAGVAVQQFQVEPDEYNTEKPYIERNIDATLQAFDLDTVGEIPFEPNYNLTYQELKNNEVTLDNIRLWDYRALKDTYSQLQLIRSYYDFNDVDIDRYTISEKGMDRSYQVMLSPRELNQMDLAEKAQTWVNQHLVYTHGYGLSLSPVNQKTEDGLPELWIKDIPPETKKNLTISRPEIYYGEKTDNFVVVNTKTEEFDYPAGGENVYTTYTGSGGVSLSGASKLAFALKFGSIQLLLSGSVTEDSKILLNRNIQNRVETIAPFLEYDADPYIVSSEGSLYWIIDAYTTTDRFPYAERFGLQNINYIRNSVKVVVNAYSGEVTFYVIEQEPLIATYQKMFPSLFTDYTMMPEDLKNHIRYPEDLFTLQAEVYATYHMTDPRVFYNREDQWKIPNELYSGSTIKMEPYYMLLNLPGTKGDSDFIIMTPFTPNGKDNMIGWMGARSDPGKYGEKVVYQFPKQKLIYGPTQIESRIDQDTEISQQMTLWSQSGSRVIRGNLLVIPVNESLLYVEPVYLRASGNSSIPQLKRVIVAFGDRLAMREDLNASLAAVFLDEINETLPDDQPPIEGDIQELINQAIETYDEAFALLEQGDFSGYASRIEQLGEILDEIDQLQEDQTG